LGPPRGYITRISGQLWDKNWGSLLSRQSKVTEKKWQRVSWVSRRQPARIWAWEQRNWSIRIIECSSVELKVWLWREDFMRAILVVPRYLECIMQWDCYSSCIRSCCQETGNGDCNRLRTLVGVTVNCKLWRLAVALQLPVVPCGVYKVSINPIIKSIPRLIVTTINYSPHLKLI
jgi:hypothetical protein